MKNGGIVEVKGVVEGSKNWLNRSKSKYSNLIPGDCWSIYLIKTQTCALRQLEQSMNTMRSQTTSTVQRMILMQ